MIDFAATSVASPGAFITVAYPTSWSLGIVSGRSIPARVLTLHDHELSADDLGDVPLWVREVLGRLSELEDLPYNWDSYGGRPLSRRHREAALSFLGRFMTDDLDLPDVVPLADGGVQLEWHQPGLEVDFIADRENPRPVVLITTDDEERQLVADDAIVVLRTELRAALSRDAPAAA